MDDDLSEEIQTVATSPASAEADGRKVTAHPLPDLIAADKYLAAKDSASRAARGLRFTRLIPPSAE